MKISENFSMYAGGDNRVVNSFVQQGKKQGESIFAGDLKLNGTQDEIAKRREQAQKEALKVVSDAFEGDLSIDKEVEDGYERIKKLQSGMHEAEVRMQEIDEQQQFLIEEQGYAPDHPELADLAEEKLLDGGKAYKCGENWYAFTTENRNENIFIIFFYK